jgi:hypothetical protein
MDVNTYKVTGTSRQVGAIGIMEPFTVNVVTESSKAAYDAVRAQLYANNRDHVQVMGIYLITDYGLTQVEPEAYLY